MPRKFDMIFANEEERTTEDIDTEMIEGHFIIAWSAASKNPG